MEAQQRQSKIKFSKRTVVLYSQSSSSLEGHLFQPAPPGLFIAPEVIPPDKALPLDHPPRPPNLPLPQQLPFSKLPNREAPPSPSPLAVDCPEAADMLLGVPRWIALSFYQQKRRQPSPDGRSLTLLQALCPALCPGSSPRIRSSGSA